MAAPTTYKISVKKNADLALSIEGRNKLVLLTKNDADFSQLWVKTDRTEKDSDGRPTFVLVNRLTGQALTSPPSVGEKVTLETCNDSTADGVDDDILWTENTKTDGYFYISTSKYSNRVLDAGTAAEEAEVTVSTQNTTSNDNQMWTLTRKAVTFGGEFRGKTQEF